MSDSSALERAQDFIWRNARLLERYQFAFLFAGGPKEPVLAALRAYQNEDGGFGNALEADKRGPHSHRADVAFAFVVLDYVGGFRDPMVQRACDYLLIITRPEGGLPFSLPSANLYPHTPWWEADDDPPPAITLTAGIAALLHKHRVGHPWLERATDYCWRAIENMEERDFDALSRVISFLEYAPDRARADAMMHRVLGWVAEPGVVELDPDAQGHTHKPPEWAPTPESLCRSLFSDEVMSKHLGALAAKQQPDGGWPISWETVSPGAELEWRGWLTIESLVTLRAYGRLK